MSGLEMLYLGLRERRYRSCVFGGGGMYAIALLLFVFDEDSVLGIWYDRVDQATYHSWFFGARGWKSEMECVR